MNEQTKQHAKVLCAYLHMPMKLEKSDCIIVHGCYDTRVAERAIDLWFEGWAPRIVFTGAKGRLTGPLYKSTEAVHFAHMAYHRGVPKDCVLIEDKATNNGENLILSKQLLRTNDLPAKKVILVHVPYAHRRLDATFQKVWSEAKCIMAAPRISFDECPTFAVSTSELIHLVAGEIDRLREYPKRGYIVEQDIPAPVMSAFHELVALGFNKHVAPAA